jgi:hypothetical protein
LVESRRRAIGGHLYIGETEWTFVPHRRNAARHRLISTIPVTRELAITVETEAPRGLVRLFRSRPISFVSLRTDASSWRLQVPAAADVCERLQALQSTSRAV